MQVPFQINRDQLTDDCAEASSLGFPPGVWPQIVSVDGQEFVILTFKQGAPIRIYICSKTGKKLRIFND